MKTLVATSLFLYTALLAQAQWLYVKDYPWVWSTEHESWEYVLGGRDVVWSMGSGEYYSLGEDYDMSRAVGGVILLEEDDLLLFYAYSGFVRMDVQFGGETLQPARAIPGPLWRQLFSKAVFEQR